MDYTLPNFKIDYRDWYKGNNSYDEYPNGTFEDQVLAMNPFSKPGTLSIAAQIPPEVNNNIVFPKGIISQTFAQNAVAFYAVCSDNSNNGFYSFVFNSGFFQPTNVVDIVASTTRSYQLGYTDMQEYLGQVYTTAGTDITKYDLGSETMNLTWWTTTNDNRTGIHALPLSSVVRHMQAVFEDILYVADGNWLHKIDNGSITTEVFKVAPGYTIQEIVSFNGLLWIFADNSSGVNVGSNINCKLYTWDGLQSSWIDEYELNNQVTTAYVFKGSMYVWTVGYMGVWNGTEINILRPLSAETLNYPVFKSLITPTEDSLLWVEGSTIMRMGKSFIPGQLYSFYRYFKTLLEGTFFAGIRSFRNNDLIVTDSGQSTHSSAYYIPDINAPAASMAQTAILNDRDFSSPVKIRGIRIHTLPLSAGAAFQPGYINDKGETVYPKSTGGTFSNANSKQAGKRVWTFNMLQPRALQSLKPVFNMTGPVYIKSVEYFYESSEDKENE